LEINIIIFFGSTRFAVGFVVLQKQYKL